MHAIHRSDGSAMQEQQVMIDSQQTQIEEQQEIIAMQLGPSSNSGGFDPRQMKLSGGSEFINYNLYTDSGRTKIWGDESGNTFALSRKVFKRAPWIATIYGRIPPRQDVSIGNYNEALTVTIVW